MSDPIDPQLPAEDPQPTGGEDHRRRMRYQWRDLMEDLIEDGRRRGLFDDLPGAGRPLDLEENFYEGSNTLANQLMKNNDIRPAWLAHRLEVMEKTGALRAEIARTWDRYRAARDQAQGNTHRPALTIGWDDACRRWEEQIEGLNREIEAFNLKRPPGQPELFKLRLADELKRAGVPRYLK
jgi:DnaJ family protein C protein 28